MPGTACPHCTVLHTVCHHCLIKQRGRLAPLDRVDMARVKDMFGLYAGASVEHAGPERAMSSLAMPQGCITGRTVQQREVF